MMGGTSRQQEEITVSSITPQQFLDAIQRIPEDRWQDVLQSIERFQPQSQSGDEQMPRIRNGEDLKHSPLIGIWADRADIENGNEFARGLRRQAEQRH
jgi:hypothetical protein